MHSLFSFRFVFVGIFVFFSGGLLLSFIDTSLVYVIWLIILLLSLVIGSCIIAKKPSILYFGAIHAAFFLLGFFAWQMKVNGFNSNSLSSVYVKGDLIQLRVTELGDVNSEWRKVIGEAVAVQKIHEVIPVSGSLVTYIEKGVNIKEQDVLILGSILEPIKNAGNPGEFDAEFFWNSKGIFHQSFVSEDSYRILDQGTMSFLTKMVSSSREYFIQILNRHLSGSDLAIARALILGDKSLVSDEIRTSFTVTGAMHVLAVSGLHIGIIMQILWVLFSRFSKWISKNQAILIVIILMWFYAAVTGLSPSVLRAVFMFTVLSLAKLTGRNYEPVNILFFTGICLVLSEPSLFFDIGFQLSFLAMLGIYLFYEPIEKLFFVDQPILKQVWQGTAIGFAAQLVTTPLSLYYFHQFPNYFIVTNIGLMASSGIILGGGILLFVIYKIPFISNWVAYLLGLSIALSFYFIQWVEGLPGAVAYGFSVGLLEVFLLFLIVYILFNQKIHLLWKRIATFGFIALLTFIVWTRYESMNKEELVIFNSKKPVILVKRQGDIHCFYGYPPEDKDKVKFLVEGYQKVNPGNVFYHNLHKNWRLEEGAQILCSIEKKEKGYVLKYKDRSIFLRTRYNSNLQEASVSEDMQINMPYLENLSGYNLSHGSFQID